MKSALTDVSRLLQLLLLLKDEFELIYVLKIKLKRIYRQYAFGIR